jgi:hypothetical protein
MKDSKKMNLFNVNKNSGFQNRVSEMTVSKNKNKGPINEYQTQNNLNVKAYQLYEIQDISIDTNLVKPNES